MIVLQSQDYDETSDWLDSTNWAEGCWNAKKMENIAPEIDPLQEYVLQRRYRSYFVPCECLTFSYKEPFLKYDNL